MKTLRNASTTHSQERGTQYRPLVLQCFVPSSARSPAIPPARPSMLRTFLGKITRNLSLNALEKMNAEKRNFGQVPLVLSELNECLSASYFEPEQQIEEEAIVQAVNRFLARLDPEQQKVFIRRYWYVSSIKEIAGDFKMSESKVKSILFRLRKKLKRELEKEDIWL
mgnify:CR=1 FL=1